MRHRFLLWLLVVTLATGSVASVASNATTKGGTVFFIPNSSGHQIVPVQINDKYNAYFLIDTGVTHSAISRRLAAKITNDILSGKKVKDNTTSVMVRKLQVGTMEMSAFSLDTLGKEEWFHLFSEPIDGVIGMDILARFGVHFDFQERKITFMYPGNINRERRKLLGMENAQEVGIHYPDPSGWCVVDIQVGPKQPVSFVIDTGSWETILPDSIIKEYRLERMPDQYRGILGMAGLVTIGKAKVPMLRTNTFDFGHTIVSVNLTEQAKAPPLLGLHLLCRFQVLLDATARKMYLKPVPPTHTSYKYNPELKIPVFSAKSAGKSAQLFVLDINRATQIHKELYHLLPHDTSQRARKRLASIAMPSVLPAPRSVWVSEDTFDWWLGPPALAGMLGWDWLFGCSIRFDFTRHQLDVIKGGYLEGTPYISDKYQKLPLIQVGNRYLVPGKINGQPTQFELNFFHLQTQVELASLPSPIIPEGKLTDSFGPRSMELNRLSRIEIGDFVWDEPVVEVYRSPQPGELSRLGLDFLKRFRVVVDFPAQYLYLEPLMEKQWRSPDQEGLGFGLSPNAKGEWNISSIMSPSPASDAMVQIGDVLLAVDSEAFDAEWLSRLGQYIKQKSEEGVTFKFRRAKDNTTYEVRLKPRRLL